MAETLEPFFLQMDDGRRGRRLCIHHAPANGVVRSAVLHVHAFAEEMNKSRRMVALQSRALAAVGVAVLRIDLLGCGDSSGDFGDATWDDWLLDVESGLAWLQARYPHARPALWGHRVGALLAHAAAARRSEAVDLILWQPVLQGRSTLQQFFRIVLAAGLDDGAGKARMAELRQALAEGRTVDVAGYRIGPRLAGPLELAALSEGLPHGRVAWLELSTRPDGAATPASQALIERWRAAGVTVEVGSTTGPQFWQTVEIEDAPELVACTVRALTALAT